MRSLKSALWSGFILLYSLVLSATAARAAGPVFLGTDPVKAATVPIPIANLSSLGSDLVGNHYYADAAAGRVLEVTKAGTNLTLFSGLNKPLIRSNYRGDVFVADTGSGRILKSTAGPKRGTAVLATVPRIHAIALDTASNVFVLSDDQLVEISAAGTVTTVATIPGATVLGTGPGADGKGALYVVSTQAGTNVAQKYSYNYSGGAGTVSSPLSNFLPNLPGASLGSIFVDLRGDVLTEATVSGLGQVVFSSASGFQKTLFTGLSPVVPTGQDSVGNYYWVDGTRLMKTQLSIPSYELLYSRDGDATDPYQSRGPETDLGLNFGAVPGVHWSFTQQLAETDFHSESLYAGTVPPDPEKLYFYYIQRSPIPGTLRGLVNLKDQNYQTSLSIPITANSMVSAEAFYLPAPNLRAHPNSQPLTAVNTMVPSVPTVLSRCECGTFDLDRNTGVITHDGHPIASGLLNVLGADVDINGTLYVTQEGITGVLRVTADGVSSHVANDISYPKGSTVDTLGNLFVISGDSVIRLAPDGSETVFATPATNGGYGSPLSIAVDLFDRVYVGYATVPNATHGAILKFTQAGSSSVVPTDTKKPTALAMYPCGALYFGDGIRGTIAVVPGYKQEKYIGFGLPNPVNLRCGGGGFITGEDASIPGRTFRVGGIPLGAYDSFNLDFGRVQVGTVRTITLSAVAVGSSNYMPDSATGAAIFADTTYSNVFYTSFGYTNEGFLDVGSIIGGSNLTDIRLEFQPDQAGRFGPAVVQESDDNSAPFVPNKINLYGTGFGTAPVY